MYKTIKIADRRGGFTLVEMLVVIAIILALAALAAAFMPRINENQRMTRAVDNLEQWLLTAKMRAKRDGLATGLRFIQTQGDMNIDPSLKLVPPGPPTIFSQFQYIQQPPPLAGGVFLGGPNYATPLLAPPPGYPPPPPGTPIPPRNPLTVTPYQQPAGSNLWYTGGLLLSAASGTATFTGVDFSLGGLPQYGVNGQPQWLVQAGDYLDVNGGGVFLIGAVTVNTLTLASAAIPLSYDSALSITNPTTNYHIIRQPRILIGEEPLALPDNYAANFGFLPGILPATAGSNVIPRVVNLTTTPPTQYFEILFSPTGAVVGNNAGNSTIVVSVWDNTMDLTDPNASQRVGVVGIQARSGFIGAYSLSLSANPFLFVQMARESGM